MERKAWEEYLQEIKVSNPRSLVELNNLGISPEDLHPVFPLCAFFPMFNRSIPESKSPT